MKIIHGKQHAILLFHLTAVHTVHNSNYLLYTLLERKKNWNMKRRRVEARALLVPGKPGQPVGCRGQGKEQ